MAGTNRLMVLGLKSTMSNKYTGYKDLVHVLDLDLVLVSQHWGMTMHCQYPSKWAILSYSGS